MWPLLLVGGALAAPASSEREAFDQAIQIASDRLGAQVDEADLYRAAIAGVAAEVDASMGTEGSALLSADQVAARAAWRRGERVGFGIEYVVIPGQGLAITSVMSGGPASGTPLGPGDVVVAVDDAPFTGQPAARILSSLSRTRSNRVVLDVRTAGGKLRRVELNRGSFQVPTAHMEPDTKSPVVRMRFFGEDSSVQLATLLETIDPHRGVVLDLRDHEGGSLPEAIAAADLFLPAGTVVAHLTEAGQLERPLKAEQPQRWTGPVVLLVNQGCAGTCELFVAALKEQIGAPIIGTRTAGVSALPSEHPLAGGLVLELADLRVKGPSGRTWSGAGLSPDALVEAPSLGLPDMRQPSPLLDLQRDTAIRMLPGG